MVSKRISSAFQRGLILAAALGLCRQSGLAGQDEDLDLIPDFISAAQPAAQPSSAAGGNSYKFLIEDEAQTNSKRHGVLLPLPDKYVPAWSNRFTFYGKADIRLTPSLSLNIVDRFNHLSDIHSAFPSGVAQNDLNEAYLSWNAYREYYLDAGRINLKSGVAVGFNPTDFFKKNAISLRTSEDPIVLRENRLGTVMARAQGILPFGTLTLAAAPEISDRPGRFITDRTSFALALQRTNARPRYLAKISSSYKAISSDLLYYRENSTSYLGANVSRSIGDSFVFYGEWSGARRYSLTTDALIYDAKLYGVDGTKYAYVVPGDSKRRFRNQAAAGFSYTESARKRSTFVEYHYNEAGMTNNDWGNWFLAGYAERLLDFPELASVYDQVNTVLWSIRDYAQRNTEPITRQQLFIRNQWQEAFTKKLDLANLLQLNSADRSFFLQSSAKYSLTDNMFLNLSIYFYAGSEHSEYGSINKWSAIKPGMTYLF
ncbi:MAG: hypothetical protein WCK75_02610 [Elusimicrobiota bacterium]